MYIYTYIYIYMYTHCTPELAEVKVHRGMPLRIHRATPLNIHWNEISYDITGLICIYIYIYKYIYIYTYICIHWNGNPAGDAAERVNVRRKVRPISLLTSSLLTLLDSRFLGNSLWTWEFHPCKLGLGLSQTP